MPGYLPNKDFSGAIYISDYRDGFNSVNDVQRECIDPYNACVSRIPSVCANCGTYCKNECDSTRLSQNKYCETVCNSSDFTQERDCLRQCNDDLKNNTSTCELICNSMCNDSSKCPDYARSRCQTESCTLPICSDNCINGNLPVSVRQSLLSKSFYYCKVDNDSNTNCLDFDPNNNQWYYNTNAASPSIITQSFMSQTPPDIVQPTTILQTEPPADIILPPSSETDINTPPPQKMAAHPRHRARFWKFLRDRRYR